MRSVNGILKSKQNSKFDFTGYYLVVSYQERVDLFEAVVEKPGYSMAREHEANDFYAEEISPMVAARMMRQPSVDDEIILIKTRIKDMEAMREKLKSAEELDEANAKEYSQEIKRLNEALKKAETAKANTTVEKEVTAKTKGLTSQRQIRVNVDEKGEFEFLVNEKRLAKDAFEVKVHAADSEELYETVETLKGLHASVDERGPDKTKPYVITLETKEVFQIKPSDDPFLGQKAKISGRVITLDGESVPAELQVVLWATKEDGVESFNRNDFSPVLVTKSDKKGYFYGDYPRGSFTAAYGSVPGAKKNSTVVIKLKKGGVFPDHVILAFDEIEQEDDEDCGCTSETPRLPDNQDLINSSESFSEDVGGGKCINFTVPNRTLEEYNYYKAVRTTEPVIKAGNLEVEEETLPSDIAAQIGRLLSNGFKFDSIKTAGMYTLAPTMAYVDTSKSDKMSGKLDVSSSNKVDVSNSGKLNVTNAGKLDFTNFSAKDVKGLLKDPDAFTPQAVMTAERKAIFAKANNVLTFYAGNNGGRKALTAANPVDWDDEPTYYQATTISHGHILRLKQVWKSDGYSLGDLLYSLPLAPCQKKQIAIFDWDRSETGFRAENSSQSERMNAHLSRDRDINEIVNSSFNESINGGSKSSTRGSGGGIGGGLLGSIGNFFLGVGGGYSSSKGSSSSSAWQNSARNVSAGSMQSLQDNVSQSASAIRNKRTTVVQQVRQGENLEVSTEVISNKNHCHAVTMEYFEVLRHIVIEQELAQVQECLFVPLQMSRFDEYKALRWKNTLRRYIRSFGLRQGFDAIERITTNYANSDLPTGIYAEESIEEIYGDMRISFILPRPEDNDDGNVVINNWINYIPFLGNTVLAIYNKYLKDRVDAEKDRIFETTIAPQIAESMVQKLKFRVKLSNGTTEELKLDPTLVSRYRPGVPLYVTLRPTLDIPAIPREDIKYVEISTDEDLPEHSKIIVHSGNMYYRTKHLNYHLFRSSFIKNDLLPGDPVVISTRLRGRELYNPRKRDRERAIDLLDHLNENVEFYHRVIWYLMDSGKRFMLLDGFIAPNSGGKSVASVVENKLIGIVGNSLVMPVAPGYHLDPTYRQDKDEPIDLLEHYAPKTPPAPYRISIPTRGVYAEAVQGACNSCEKKDDSRFWRFEESPCGDEPTAIGTINTDTRRADPGNLQAQDFTAPIIAMQNAPAAPNPTGFGPALDLMGKSGIFENITGLDQNQKNALAALQINSDAAQGYAKQAADLAKQASMLKNLDKTIDTIESAKKKGLINDEQASKLTESALRSSMGGGSETPGGKLVDTPEVKKLVEGAAASGGKDVKIKTPGESVEVTQPKTEESLKDSSPSINLSGNSAQARSFNPASNDKAGVTTLSAVVSNLPAGATVRWRATDANLVAFESPNANTTKAFAKKGGKTDVFFEIVSGASVVASEKIEISVPQFFFVTEDKAAFDGALTNLNIDYLKDNVVEIAKETTDKLLTKANVRFIWSIKPYNESLPAQFIGAGVAFGQFTTVNIKGAAATAGLLGETLATALPTSSVSNEIINLYPDEYRRAGADVSTPLQSFVTKMLSLNYSDVRLVELWLKIVGRMIGETLAHEALHSIIATSAAHGDHNNPAIANDLMNKGSDRDIIHRAGLNVTDDTNFPDVGTYTISPSGPQSTVTATTQTRINSVFPVPPGFR